MTAAQEKALRHWLKWVASNSQQMNAVDEIVNFIKMTPEQQLTTLQAHVLRARADWDGNKAKVAASQATVEAEIVEMEGI